MTKYKKKDIRLTGLKSSFCLWREHTMGLAPYFWKQNFIHEFTFVSHSPPGIDPTRGGIVTLYSMLYSLSLFFSPRARLSRRGELYHHRGPGVYHHHARVTSHVYLPIVKAYIHFVGTFSDVCAFARAERVCLLKHQYCYLCIARLRRLRQ